MSENSMLVRSKTHAWFKCQRTIVRQPLNNDALPIEALFVGAGLNIGMNG